MEADEHPINWIGEYSCPTNQWKPTNTQSIGFSDIHSNCLLGSSASPATPKKIEYFFRSVFGCCSPIRTYLSLWEMAVFMRSPPIALFEAEFWMMRTDHFFGIWIAEQPFREVVEVMDSAGVNEGSNYWSQGYSGQTTEHQGAESRGNDFDVDFSYWDLKLHAALGHLLKDFDGAVSFDELGPRFGGYGSFLPVQQCSPSVLQTPRRTAAVQNYSSENFLNEGTVEQVTCSVSGVTSTKMMSLANKNPPGSGALAPDFENELLLAANAVKDNDPPPVKIPLVVNDVKDNSRKKLKVHFKKASDSVS